jgi:adenylylsulfate kinase
MADTDGWALWLTGLPAAGKTALACAIRQKLGERGVNVVILDSDELRSILTPTPAYTSEERAGFYQTLVELSALLVRYRANVIIAATGNLRAYRQPAREQIALFAEVWVRCPVAMCRARDPKGLYAQADAGTIHDLPGVDAPYEPPEAPEVVVDTDLLAITDAADRILAGIPFLKRDIEQHML